MTEPAYKIEKGIPFKKGYHSRTGLGATFLQMEIGDSFIMPTRTSRGTPANVAKSLGMKIKTQLLKDDDGLRVWRIE